MNARDRDLEIPLIEISEITSGGRPVLVHETGVPAELLAVAVRLIDREYAGRPVGHQTQADMNMRLRAWLRGLVETDRLWRDPLDPGRVWICELG